MSFSYVSRGAYKLKAAFENFNFKVENQRVMDIGSSTGGFTQILLEYKAQFVYCVDVGYNQLDYKLRIHPQVQVMEKTNILHFHPSLIPQDLFPTQFVCDVSFISLKKIFPILHRLRFKEGIILIKPQFEIGKQIPNFNGIIQDKDLLDLAIHQVQNYALDNHYQILEITPSPIKGQKGNQEFLAWIKAV